MSRRKLDDDRKLARSLNSEAPAEHATADALEWPEGSYVLLRLPTAAFRDKPAAVAEALRRHPGAVVGKSAIARGAWYVRIRPAGWAPQR